MRLRKSNYSNNRQNRASVWPYSASWLGLVSVRSSIAADGGQRVKLLANSFRLLLLLVSAPRNINGRRDDGMKMYARPYIRMGRMEYTENGTMKHWDCRYVQMVEVMVVGAAAATMALPAPEGKWQKDRKRFPCFFRLAGLSSCLFSFSSSTNSSANEKKRKTTLQSPKGKSETGLHFSSSNIEEVGLK